MLFKLPSNRRFDVVGIGRNSWDRIAVAGSYPVPDSKISLERLDNQAGGQVATTMVAVARLGARVRYLGKFGDDAGGRAVRAALVREGIDLSESKVVPGVSNQSAFIVVDKTNHTRTVFSYCDPRLDLFNEDFSQDVITSGKILFLGGRHPDSVVAFAQAAKLSGSLVVVDADNPSSESESLLENADVVICPENFPKSFTGERNLLSAFQSIVQAGPQMICCTRGSAGSMLYFKGHILEMEAFAVDVVDTTGAGDVFQGGLLWALLNGFEIQEILRFSNAVAAIKCQVLGGQAGIPKLPEVEQFLSSHS